MGKLSDLCDEIKTLSTMGKFRRPQGASYGFPGYAYGNQGCCY